MYERKYKNPVYEETAVFWLAKLKDKDVLKGYIDRYGRNAETVDFIIIPVEKRRPTDPMFRGFLVKEGDPVSIEKFEDTSNILNEIYKRTKEAKK